MEILTSRLTQRSQHIILKIRIKIYMSKPKRGYSSDSLDIHK